MKINFLLFISFLGLTFACSQKNIRKQYDPIKLHPLNSKYFQFREKGRYYFKSIIYSIFLFS